MITNIFVFDFQMQKLKKKNGATHRRSIAYLRAIDRGSFPSHPSPRPSHRRSVGRKLPIDRGKTLATDKFEADLSATSVAIDRDRGPRIADRSRDLGRSIGNARKCLKRCVSLQFEGFYYHTLPNILPFSFSLTK